MCLLTYFLPLASFDLDGPVGDLDPLEIQVTPEASPRISPWGEGLAVNGQSQHGNGRSQLSQYVSALDLRFNETPRARF